MIISEPLGPRCMSQDSHQSPRWPEPLASRLGVDADIDQVVDAIMAIWHESEIALSPIIGRLGVAALFYRSLNVVSTVHPWLRAAVHGDALDSVDPSALKAALLQQPAAAAAAGGAALFQSLHDVLASLVGTPLTDRLLHSVWAPSKGDTSAQDLLS